MPLFKVKKEVFEWVKTGQKTIDMRKGRAWKGTTATFQCGPYHLRMKISRKEEGRLSEILREDNYRVTVPSARTLSQARDYLLTIYPDAVYPDAEDVFTAYYLKKSHKAPSKPTGRTKPSAVQTARSKTAKTISSP